MTTRQQVLSNSETRAVERLIVDTQFKIHQLMKNEGLTKADLAKRLNCSKSRVTQMFGDKPNLTLETLARVFYALNDECNVTSEKVAAIISRLKNDVNRQARVENASSRSWQWRQQERSLNIVVSGSAKWATDHFAAADGRPVREERSVIELSSKRQEYVVRRGGVSAQQSHECPVAA